MAKPQINRITPFDAKLDTTITFNWTGFQPYSNRIIIYENKTLSVVFDNTVESMVYKHIIPNGTLQNGNTYIIQCQVFDQYNNESELSNKYYFKTYTTPQFYFDSLINGQTITTASCSATIFYFQPESEPLSYYKFSLYDSHKTLISQTNDIYDVDNISYTYKGLSTESIYYIRCEGLTKNAIPVDTGFLEIYVNYGIKHNYARIYVENDSRTGGITYRTNINVVMPDGDNYKYVDNKIDLVGKTITYKEGFNINDNFTLKLSGDYLYRSGDVILLKNGENIITISSYIYDDNSVRYKITIPNGISNYIIYSNPLFANNNTLITLVVRRIDGLYSIKAYAD